MLYDLQSDKWEVHDDAFDAALFPKRQVGANALASVGGSILSFGGADEFDKDLGRANSLSLTGRYKVETRTWEALPQEITPREGLVIVRRNGSALLIGGMSGD